MKEILCCAAMLACGFTVRQGVAQSRDSTAPLTARAAARLLEQATWGPTLTSISQLQSTTMDAWMQAQFALNTSDLPDQPISTPGGAANNNTAPVLAAFFQNAVTGQDQLRQRVAFALSEIWVVSSTAGVPNAYAFPPYWRIFRDNAFGNYRDLVKAVTLNPAMGHYLNMANNMKGTGARAANENYARELLQLFTLGLNQLNPDGSYVPDGNGNPLPTYNQTVVTNLARALTGWTFPPTPPNSTVIANSPPYYFGQMVPIDAQHDTTEKDIFGGIKIPAGQTAAQDLESVLDALMSQPTMAPFVSQQLIQHLVTSSPSPAYIQRVAQVFSNTNGNLQAVVSAILSDAEARAGDADAAPIDAIFGHLREPVLLLTNVLRGLNASAGPSNAISGFTAQLDQKVLGPPNVFSYFSPQYRLPQGTVAPEFQIYSSQTVLNRANVVNRVLYGTLDPTTRIDLTAFLQVAGNSSQLIGLINTCFLHGAMSNDLQQNALSAIAAAATSQRKVLAALYVVLTSGEYQIIH